MRMHIQLLKRAAGLKEQLEKTGWRVATEQDGALLASNEGIVSETDARYRLHQLGWLTSANLRIHFSPHETRAAGVPAASLHGH